jgi:hypothetical protein
MFFYAQICNHNGRKDFMEFVYSAPVELGADFSKKYIRLVDKRKLLCFLDIGLVSFSV